MKFSKSSEADSPENRLADRVTRLRHMGIALLGISLSSFALLFLEYLRTIYHLENKYFTLLGVSNISSNGLISLVSLIGCLGAFCLVSIWKFKQYL